MNVYLSHPLESSAAHGQLILSFVVGFSVYPSYSEFQVLKEHVCILGSCFLRFSGCQLHYAQSITFVAIYCQEGNTSLSIL